MPKKKVVYLFADSTCLTNICSRRLKSCIEVFIKVNRCFLDDIYGIFERLQLLKTLSALYWCSWRYIWTLSVFFHWNICFISFDECFPPKLSYSTLHWYTKIPFFYCAFYFSLNFFPYSQWHAVYLFLYNWFSPSEKNELLFADICNWTFDINIYTPYSFFYVIIVNFRILFLLKVVTFS